MNKNSKIFITGHAGLVGSALYKNLIRNGYKNIIVAKKTKLDLRNLKKVNFFFKKKKIEYLVMCAAKVGGIMDNLTNIVDYYNDNILIQNNLLNAALKFRVKKTIFLGTSCIYPESAKIPILEDSLFSGKLNYTNEGYAVAKLAGITLSKILYKQYGLDIVALMPTNIYGPNDKYNEIKSHVIPALILKFLNAKKKNLTYVKLWGDGSPQREFLYSEDLAEAIRIVLNTSKEKLFNLCKKNFPIINIGSGDIYSIKELASIIAKKVDYRGKIYFDKSYPNGTLKKNLNFQKILKLKWRPKILLNQGLDVVLKEMI
jgi:GDP-L-fucose synthase